MTASPSRTARIFRWALFNGFTLNVAWFSLVEGRTWAAKLLTFTTVVYAILGLVVFSGEARKAARSAGRSVPAWLSVGCDLPIMLGCAAAGHFWLAAAWLWVIVSEQVAHAPEIGGSK